MSTFEVKVRRIEVSAHPDPETTALEVGKVDDYMVVVGKGQYQTGNLVAYIPESALLPPGLIEEMNLAGKLAGAGKNRVKAIKLRKVLSQGLCYPAREGWTEGQDVASELGITKWTPVIPPAMAGEVNRIVIHNEDREVADVGFKFDIENIKKYPRMFEDNEDVTVTEKIHGTFMVIGLMPASMAHPDMVSGCFFVSSKGLAAQGLFMKDNERNANNLYVRTAKDPEMDLCSKLKTIAINLMFDGKVKLEQPVWLVGEVFGNGVQDLKYGQERTTYRAFGIKVGDRWMDYDEFLATCGMWDIPTVPVLYRGPYSKHVVDKLTKGKTVAGNGCHIREGVVVCATKSEANGGRKILKSVSEDYLLRKNNDATEFE